MGTDRSVIRTPDQHLRVFVSSTLGELAEERAAARRAVTSLRLAPVMFELGARPHSPRDLYRAYLDQSHIFIGIYWQRYGWLAPGETVSGLEDEYRLSGSTPKLIYIKTPAPEREPRLQDLLDRIRGDDTASYKSFSTPAELAELITNDVALLLTERFEMTRASGGPHTQIAERPGHDLPAQLTPFIGREQEVVAVSDLVRHDDARLVTLTGPGGVGKSRLALQVAAAVLDQFEDGAFCVDLVAISDPALVVPTIARTLGVQERGGRGLLDSLKDDLGERHLLLLLDNFEQIASAAPLVVDLLATCPRLTVLVTSRAPLHVRGEREFPVPPLALPDRERLSSLEELSRYEVVRLFVERAQATKPGFALMPENAPAVAEICSRLDGLPLAIELAAARIKTLSPSALLARLEHRLDLLTGGARDLPARQQTLRDTLDWSYDLLSADEQRLFARLGVFAGGACPAAVEAICDGQGDLDVLNGIASLVDNSLVQQEETSTGESRFAMLATVREYALERLTASGDAAALRRQHAAYYLTLVEPADPRLRGSLAGEWLDRLELEHDNLRAALHWSIEQGQADLAAGLAGAIWPFWRVRGYLSEGQLWLEGVLRLKPATMDPERARLWAMVLHAAGVLTMRQANDSAAQAWLQEGLALHRELEDSAGIAMSLNALAWVADLQGDDRGATARYTESLALYRKLGDKLGIADVLNNLGTIAQQHGDFGRARALSEEALSLDRELEYTSGTARSLANLGRVAGAQGDYERATVLYREAVAALRDLGDRVSIAYGLEGLAQTAAGQGRFGRAARLFGAASALREAIRAPLSSRDRAVSERSMAAARAALGEASFPAAWAEGQAMTLEQAVAYAQGAADDDSSC